jgi:hypothetical protein
MTVVFPPDDVTTRAAQQVWEYAYNEPWPEGWTVGWQGLEQLDGLCDHTNQRIELSWWLKDKEEDEVLFTLVHEFTHLRRPTLRHGNGFNRQAGGVYARMIGESVFQQSAEVRAEAAGRRRELREQQRKLREMREEAKRLGEETKRLERQLAILKAEADGR